MSGKHAPKPIKRTVTVTMEVTSTYRNHNAVRYAVQMFVESGCKARHADFPLISEAKVVSIKSEEVDHGES